MNSIDIAPFALPNTDTGELRFEEPRDIERLTVTFAGPVPKRMSVHYLRKVWPETRFENDGNQDLECPSYFGWVPIDDQFNSSWQKAAISTAPAGRNSVQITFKGLRRELGSFPGDTDYDVTYRRTLGIRIDAGAGADIRKLSVHNTSAPTRSAIRVELDAGRKTPSTHIDLSAYNATIGKVTGGPGVAVKGRALVLRAARKRTFRFTVAHMHPAHRFASDDGLVTFALDKETFTVSMNALDSDGPIWFAEQGIYIARADDSTSYLEYRARAGKSCTINAQITKLANPDTADPLFDSRAPYRIAPGEQSLAGAYAGQPRAHATSWVVGCKQAHQRYWIEANGDVVLEWGSKGDARPKEEPRRFKHAGGAGRFFFGMERWRTTGRFNDPAPVMAYNIHVQRGDIFIEQKIYAVPLEKSILTDELKGDDTTIGMVRFRFRNSGESAATVELPISYSCGVGRGLHPNSITHRDQLSLRGGLVHSMNRGEKVLRCRVESTMTMRVVGDAVLLRKRLKPGETCDAVLKIPVIHLDTAAELKALAGLDFNRGYRDVTRFWRRRGQDGAQISTPELWLDSMHTAHLGHVDITDLAVPENPELIATAVGTNTYGTFGNESTMIIHELDERGLHQEARRRLELWLKYQGTAGLQGNFTDHDDVFFGAGGYENGASYCQHHGWIMWCLAEHYFFTRDVAWLKRVADELVAGAEWVARQRRQTMEPLPHSRGWETGWFPAGALEDTTDYCYWLTTQTMTWRGVDSAAKALADIDHPEAARIQKEADDFGAQLRRGFETARQHTPLVRLLDGRWIPYYPSRLYRRGRDMGWIRETLEGSVYLLLSGLYDSKSKTGAWILDDYQDNRYMTTPHGYPIENPPRDWFSRGGFSIQPNLLAGLIPHLDRDEPEIYIWMFYNAWCACYREEINSMVEHPLPVLGTSNFAHPKTSDESNAVAWLRYMIVYAPADTLYLGRAIPRNWMKQGNDATSLKNAGTRFGRVSVTYQPVDRLRKMTLSANLSLRRTPGRIVARFRHPKRHPIKSVKVNGKTHTNFDAEKGDVDITGRQGKLVVVATF